MAAGSGTFARYGQVLKGGGERRPEEVDPGRAGPATADNAYAGPRVVYGPNPISAGQAQQLFMATSLTSPMVRGRFRSQQAGAGENRATTTDLGSLQVLRGMYQGPQGVRLGAQAGPSSQPAFPSTNNDVTVTGLGMMDLPSLWRVNT
jgi:hypothetical protein